MEEIIELTDEMLEQVNGGVFVQTKNGWYHLVEDTRGLYLGSTPPDDADNLHIYAENHHVSAEIITPQEYEERFHKAFVFGN